MNVLRIRLIKTLFVSCALFVCSCSNQSESSLRYDPEKYLYDNASLLPYAQEKRIHRYLEFFREEKNITFVAVTQRSLQGRDINDYTNELFERWALGKRTNGRGILFVLAAQEAVVRMEIGYELEGLLPDAFIHYIEHEQMLPFFAQGRVGQGFEATVELIVDQLQELMVSDGSERKLSGDHLSGGGGAKAEVSLFSRTEPEKKLLTSGELVVFEAGETPEITFKRYLERLKRRVKDPRVGIFTPETQVFMADWTVTNAQQNREYKSIASKPYRAVKQGNYAVILFDDPDKKASPFFLRKSADGWQIDLFTMSQTIRFNRGNDWRLVSKDHPYAFAFEK